MSEEDNTGNQGNEEYGGQYLAEEDRCPMSGTNKCPSSEALQRQCTAC